MFERFSFDRDKLGKEKKKQLYKELENIEKKLGEELKTDETSDMIAMELKTASGEKKKRWFMKAEELPYDGEYVKLKDFLEASAKFPDLEIGEALKKIKEEKEK